MYYRQYNCQPPVNTWQNIELLLSAISGTYYQSYSGISTWQNIELLLSAISSTFTTIRTTYYRNYGISTWQNIELLLSAICSTCTTYYRNYGISTSVHQYIEHWTLNLSSALHTLVIQVFVSVQLPAAGQYMTEYWTVAFCSSWYYVLPELRYRSTGRLIIDLECTTYIYHLPAGRHIVFNIVCYLQQTV